MRVRRPVLPALAAAFAGALVAGAATFMAGPTAETSADQPPLSVDRTGAPGSGGDLALPDGSRTSAPSATSTTTTTTEPVPTSEAAPTTTTTPPAPPPATDPPATTAAPDASVQEQVASLTNDERRQAGCGPLAIDASIAAAAQGHASDMASRDYFEHTTPEGVTFDQRIREAGYGSPGAENIARGAQTAEQVVGMWMDSPGHRANILNCELTAIGIGLDRNGFYWVQDFGF